MIVLKTYSKLVPNKSTNLLFDSNKKTFFPKKAHFFSPWSLQERKPLLKLTLIEKESIEVGEEVGNQSVVETKA